MKKLFILGMMFLTLVLGACSNEESTASAEKEKDPQTIENEFITGAIDYATANEKAVDQLDYLFSDLENVEDPTWQSEVESVLMDLYMNDTSYFVVEAALSDAQVEKYSSTIDHYYESSKISDSIIDDVTAAAETYDKRKLQEVQKLFPKFKNELGKMKEQLEVERYE